MLVPMCCELCRRTNFCVNAFLMSYSNEFPINPVTSMVFLWFRFELQKDIVDRKLMKRKFLNEKRDIILFNNL